MNSSLKRAQHERCALLSPEFAREFMQPAHEELVSYLRQGGM
jgi:hypothetical protein